MEERGFVCHRRRIGGDDTQNVLFSERKQFLGDVRKAVLDGLYDSLNFFSQETVCRLRFAGTRRSDYHRPLNSSPPYLCGWSFLILVVNFVELKIWKNALKYLIKSMPPRLTY